MHTHKIVDGVEIELTPQEISDIQARETLAAQEMAAELAAQQAEEEKKASALAKLTALGLTADEIKAITGT